MKNELTSVQKNRIRSLKDDLCRMKAVVKGLNQMHEREKNPEKAAMIMDDIQQKSGIIVSMENRISKIESGEKF